MVNRYPLHGARAPLPEWLTLALTLHHSGLSPPDVGVALAAMGYPRMCVELGMAAATSEEKRAARAS